MGRSQREKGKRGERELTRLLEEYGYDRRRGQQYCGASGDADVVGLPGTYIECKRVERLNLEAAMDQSVNDAEAKMLPFGDEILPTVFHRRDHGGQMVTMRLEDRIKQYREWDSGRMPGRWVMAYMDVDYLAEIITFERWLEANYLPVPSQLLWYKMTDLFNQSGWSGQVIVDNLRLMAAISMDREATFIKARDELIKASRIVYQKGRKGSPNKYKIVCLTFKSIAQSEVYQVVQNEVLPVAESEVQNADIFRHKQKQNNKKGANVPKEKRFIPPPISVVGSYCQEWNNGIDAGQFVDYYQPKGWIIGKNRMKDWRTAMRTWERGKKGGIEGGSVTGNDHPDTGQKGRTYSDGYLSGVGERSAGF